MTDKQEKELRGKLSGLCYREIVGTFPSLSRDVLCALADKLTDKILAKVQPLIEEAKKEIIDVLKNYGISITNEGILAPYSDEWDYLYDTPRRVMLRGNDKGESAKVLWQALSAPEGNKEKLNG